MYRVGHLEVETPWGNAGGVVKTPEEVELMAHTGVGWIEVGSYTLEPRVGNSPNGEIVYHHDPATGETYNSLGMPNPGTDALAPEIPAMVEIANAHGKPLVVNVAPVSGEPISETQELVDIAYGAGADAVLLNAGCPNVLTEDGGRHEILSHNAEALENVVLGLNELVEKYDKKVFVRISPFEDYPSMRQVLRRLSPKAISAIFTPNTWPNQVAKDSNGNNILEVPGGAGGKSGPATAEASYRQLSWALTASKIGGRQIDVVSCSGILNGKEMARRMHLGAAACGGTTLYYESAEEGWSEATDRLLREYVEAENSAPTSSFRELD